MKHKLRLTLTLGEASILIGDDRDSTPYRLLAGGISGTEGAEQVLGISDYAQRDGGMVTASHVSGREITLRFEIADYDDRARYRDALLSFFKPHTNGTLSVERTGDGIAGAQVRTIGCLLWGSIRMTQESLYDFIRVEVPLYCPDPYFYTERTPRVLSRTAVGGLTFPLTVTEDSGITVGVWTTADRLSVTNDGDTETGFLINILPAEQTPGMGAAIEHPCITLAETGEFIRILDTIDLGDTLTVCTLPGAKYILKNGVRMMRFDRGSTFFSLPVGRSTLRLSSDSHLGNMEASVSWRTRHLGA